MNKQGILIICLILCFICSFQLVTAAEIDTNITSQDSIQTTDVDHVSVEKNNTLAADHEDNDVISNPDGSFSDLETLLSTGTTIELNDNYKYVDGDGDTLKQGIIISKDLTIDGKGHTIDGSGKARIFNITTGCKVILNNITFINGYASDGGAIYSDGRLVMDHCTFKDNHATHDGGALYFEAVPGNLTYLEFTRNTASHNGGAIFTMK